MNGRRVVVTGIGVTAPGDTGTGKFWELLTSGRTATRTITFFDPSGFRSRIAAECDFDPVASGLSPQEIRRMDRAAQLAVVSAREAYADSGLDTGSVPPERIGTSIGSAVGCTMGLEEEYVVVSDGGRRWLVDPAYRVPHLYGYLVPSTLAAEVARDRGAEGPAALISTGCTSGLDAVGHGCRLIQEGAADVVVAGATDAPISPITVACFDAIRATSPNNDDPEHASRPFDRRRDGFVLGEGAAVMVLEDLETARRRGASVYCEIVGFASRSNAFHMTGLKPDGREMAEAIRVAMDEARLNPEDVDYINAHGSGTKQNDRHETAAFKLSLGERARQVPVSSIKSMVGHSLGAIGSIELAASALAIEHQVVPPTANLHEPDPECDLDYVPLTAREHPIDVVLSVGSGFGGFQSAMLLREGARMTAVVTGIGVVAPNGLGTDAYWSAVLDGTSGIGPITRFDPETYPVRHAGEVRDFVAGRHVPSRVLVETDHWTHLALAATVMALDDAGADPGAFPEYDMAVATASSSGGCAFGQRELERLWSRGPRHVGAYQSIAWFYAATTGQISIRHKMRGPCGVMATEQAGGIDAVGQARRLVRAGTRLVVTGGTDASLSPYGLTTQLATGLLSTDGAYLPFDAGARGYVPGEGGAILIVEDGTRETRDPYGEIAGYAATFDPAPGSGRPPGLRRAIEGALADASLDPGDIDAVFADAIAVPELDRQEAEAIGAVFGAYGVSVTAPKTLTGRLYGGGAALDVATALLTLRHQVIPPTAGVGEVPAVYEIDIVTGRPRPVPVHHALVIARGHGGFNSALIVSSPNNTRRT